VSRPRLSDSELSFFRTFGFVVLRNALSGHELATMNAEFDRAMAAQHPEPFDGTRRHNAVMMDEDTPFYASLMEDPRFLAPAQQLYGDDVLGVCVDGNRYVGDTAWHPDSSSPHQFGVKFAIYLQPVRAASGALRVLPGSHRLFPWPQDFFDGMQRRPIAEVPAFALDSDPGDVVAFDLRMWHASCGGAADRRMCTVVYYADVKTPEGQDLLRRQGAQNVENMKHANGLAPMLRTHLYSASWVANPGRSAVRQRWIDRLTEIGYLTAPGLVERPEPAPR
jgi:hypothetical protein